MDVSLDDFFRKAHQYHYEIPEAFLSQIAFVILSALSFMKSKEFIHRDIKPSNILINKDGEIKVNIKYKSAWLIPYLLLIASDL